MISWKGILGVVSLMVLVITGLVVFLLLVQGKPVNPFRYLFDRTRNFAELKASFDIPDTEELLKKSIFQRMEWNPRLSLNERLDHAEQLVRIRKQQIGQLQERKISDVDFQLVLARINCSWKCDVENGKKTETPADLKSSSLELAYDVESSYAGISVADITFNNEVKKVCIPSCFSGFNFYDSDYGGVLYTRFNINKLPEFSVKPFTLCGLSIKKWGNYNDSVLQRAVVRDLLDLKEPVVVKSLPDGYPVKVSLDKVIRNKYRHDIAIVDVEFDFKRSGRLSASYIWGDQKNSEAHHWHCYGRKTCDKIKMYDDFSMFKKRDMAVVFSVRSLLGNEQFQIQLPQKTDGE